MNNELYPLKFQPILKEKIWGGEKLRTLLHKKGVGNSLGESWEISAIRNDVSVLTNGVLKGYTLLDLIEQYKTQLLGDKIYTNYGHQFPLLFKFIDAHRNLSLQLHPNDELAQERHHSFGKTEMWYILQSEKGAGIYLGFKEGVDEKEYLKHLGEGSLEKIMNFEKVYPGEVFFIRPGLVHSIGKGVLLAEIQQSSDITYRVFDWNRVDKNGRARMLHTDLALEAIDFDFKDFRVNYRVEENRFQTLVDHKYFRTRVLGISGEVITDYTALDSFVVLMGVAGRVEVKTMEETVVIKEGETLMLPACVKEVSYQSNAGKILEVSIGNDK